MRIAVLEELEGVEALADESLLFSNWAEERGLAGTSYDLMLLSACLIFSLELSPHFSAFSGWVILKRIEAHVLTIGEISKTAVSASYPDMHP